MGKQRKTSSSTTCKFSTETSVTKDRLTREKHTDVFNTSFYMTHKPSQGSEWRPEGKNPSGFMLGWMNSGKSWEDVTGQRRAELSRPGHFTRPDWSGYSTPVSLPGEYLWTEEPCGLQSMGSQRVGQNWVSRHIAHISFMYFNQNSVSADRMQKPRQ